MTDFDAAIVVALGGNLAGAFGASETLLQAALGELATRDVRIVARSSWWRSAAWPDPTQPEYHNGVVLAQSGQGPLELLAVLRGVEAAFGRAPDAPRNAARTLDLDLIAHGRTVMQTPALTLPHPRAHDRLFVMGPLAEIAPGWRHPVNGRTAAELAATATVGRDARPVLWR